MKRFIDLRGQHTGSRLAWYCTVRDCFEAHGGVQAWQTAQEFLHDLGGDEATQERYRSLMPPWAWDPPVGEEVCAAQSILAHDERPPWPEEVRTFVESTIAFGPDDMPLGRLRAALREQLRADSPHSAVP